MRNIFVFFLGAIFLMGCAQRKSKPITEVSQNEMETVILVDVRTPEEYAAGHLDNALNINWYDADFADQIGKIDKDNTIYVYCKKGGRSAKAAQMLDSLGFKAVVDLEGGYDAFTASTKD